MVGADKLKDADMFSRANVNSDTFQSATVKVMLTRSKIALVAAGGPPPLAMPN
jgi:hypothetical protein